jgi:hypothetical protein
VTEGGASRFGLLIGVGAAGWNFCEVCALRRPPLSCRTSPPQVGRSALRRSLPIISFFNVSICHQTAKQRSPHLWGRCHEGPKDEGRLALRFADWRWCGWVGFLRCLRFTAPPSVLSDRPARRLAPGVRCLQSIHRIDCFRYAKPALTPHEWGDRRSAVRCQLSAFLTFLFATKRRSSDLPTCGGDVTT